MKNQDNRLSGKMCDLNSWKFSVIDSQFNRVSHIVISAISGALRVQSVDAVMGAVSGALMGKS